MGYQFHCPQGHLLEADPATIGQPTICPICGVPFLVPAPVASPVPTLPVPAAPLASPLVASAPGPAPVIGPQAGSHAGRSDAPSAEFAWSPARGSRPKRASQVEFATESDEPLHIPCPNGHELEVPREMLEQDALCPTCQLQFRLRAKDSIEHKRRQREAYERRQHKLGQAWLNWSVTIAVIVILGLLVLLALRAGK